MSPILLYQFVNLLGRFGVRVLHPYFFLNQINRAVFASNIAFHAAYPGPGARLSNWETAGPGPRWFAHCLLTSYCRTLAKGFRVLYYDVCGMHDAHVRLVLWVLQLSQVVVMPEIVL